MLDEEIIVKIVKAIRSNPFLKKYSDIICKNPTIDIKYLDDENKLELCSIEFDWYDRIVVSKKAISFVEYHNHSSSDRHVLLEYNGWKGLCDIFGIEMKDS